MNTQANRHNTQYLQIYSPYNKAQEPLKVQGCRVRYVRKINGYPRLKEVKTEMKVEASSWESIPQISSSWKRATGQEIA